jgi:hypothetical protein
MVGVMNLCSPDQIVFLGQRDDGCRYPLLHGRIMIGV